MQGQIPVPARKYQTLSVPGIPRTRRPLRRLNLQPQHISQQTRVVVANHVSESVVVIHPDIQLADRGAGKAAQGLAAIACDCYCRAG